MRTALLMLFAAAIAAGQAENENIVTVIPSTNSSGAPVAPGQLRFRDLQIPSRYSGLQSPTAVGQLTIVSATAANPMVLTLNAAPPVAWTTGTSITISGASGPGCSSMDGAQSITGITGTAVTISLNGTGCSYTPSTAQVMTNWIWNWLTGPDTAGCVQSDGAQNLFIGSCSGGSGSAAGPTSSLQYNCAGAFCGDARLEYTPGFGISLTGTVNSVFLRDVGTGTLGAGGQSAMTFGLTNTASETNGVGPSMLFQSLNSAGSVKYLGRVTALWNDVTAGSESGEIAFQIRANSADNFAETTELLITPVSAQLPNNYPISYLDLGNNNISVVYLDSTDNVDIGATTATNISGNGWLNFWAQGTEWLQLTNTGELKPNGMETVNLADATHAFGSIYSGNLTLLSTSAGGIATLELESQNANGNFVRVQGAANVTATYFLSVPPNPGTNGYLLETDGSGNTSWVASPPCANCLLTPGGQTVTGIDTFNQPIYLANNIYLYGLDLGGTARAILGLDNSNNVDIGATTATSTSTGWLNFWAQGTEWLQLTNTGELKPNGMETVNLADATHAFGSIYSGNLTLLSTSAGGIATLELESQNANGNFVRVQGAANVTATYFLSVPPNPGANGYLLETDGSGNTSWVASPPCANCLLTTGGQTITGSDTWDAAQTFTDGSFPLSIIPSSHEIQPANDIWSLGDLSHQFYQLYIESGIFLQSSTGILEWGPSDTAFLNSAGGATFTSSLSVGGAVNPSASNTYSLGNLSAYWSAAYLETATIGTSNSNASTIFIGTGGNFYDRPTGAASTGVNCSGVSDGWLATSSDPYIVVCVGGNRYRATLSSY